jgi:hypothetical protein
MNLSQPAEPTRHEPHGVGAPASGTSGVVLLVLKHFLMCRCQPGTLELVARKVVREHAQALISPDPTGFYPADSLDAIAEAMCLYLTDGDPESFGELVYEISLFGFRHGFRHAIELADARRVLDSLPELWERLEPGRRTVQVAHGPTSSVLSIAPAPCSHEELREQATVAAISALLFAATGHVPGVALSQSEAGGLEIRVNRLHS